jgi:hypothetical protein
MPSPVGAVLAQVLFARSGFEGEADLVLPLGAAVLLGGLVLVGVSIVQARRTPPVAARTRLATLGFGGLFALLGLGATGWGLLWGPPGTIAVDGDALVITREGLLGATRRLPLDRLQQAYVYQDPTERGEPVRVDVILDGEARVGLLALYRDRRERVGPLEGFLGDRVPVVHAPPWADPSGADDGR